MKGMCDLHSNDNRTAIIATDAFIELEGLGTLQISGNKLLHVWSVGWAEEIFVPEFIQQVHSAFRDCCAWI